MDTLDLSTLPDLPQTPRLIEIARAVWADPRIVALWLGGSFARQAGDQYSDIDLRIAVRPEDYTPELLAELFAPMLEDAVAQIQLPLHSGAVLHHMLLSDGVFYDLLFQSIEQQLSQEARLVLGCRDAAFAQLLATGADPVVNFPPATAEIALRCISDFWMGQQKHLRVIHRGLAPLGWEGEHRLRHELMRLWFIDATGTDCGPIGRLTIHTYTPVARALAAQLGHDRLAQIGQPLVTRDDLLVAIAWSRREVAEAGRRVAERLGFSYPAALEETVLRSWTVFEQGFAHGD
jgi:predicted nucleotidyltransferase